MTAVGLGSCTVCNGQVAMNATSCPHCGARFTSPMSLVGAVIGLAGSIGWLIIWAFVAIFILLFVVGLLTH